MGSSIQFFLDGFSREKIRAVVSACAERGVQLKFFGEDTPQGYTSRYDSWQYLGEQLPLRLPYVPAEDLPALYRLAHVVAFPSLAEGYGLPAVEAFAAGTPLVASAV